MAERTSTIVLTSAAFFLFTSVCGLAAEYTHIWIDQKRGVNKSDTPGTQEQPFRSITYALTRTEYLGRSEPWWVHVGPGIYDANSVKAQNEQEAFPITLRHGMIFEGADPCSCILDGRYDDAGNSALLFAELATVEVRGLTLRNMIHYGAGVAIELVNCAGRIENCVFHHNDRGLWLAPPVGPPRPFDIMSCKFNDNELPGGGGSGFHVEGNLTGNIVNCTFAGNRAYTCGGFRVTGSLNGNVEGCMFWGNTAGSGAGFYAHAVNGDITRCTFEGNSIGGGFQVDLLNGDVTKSIFIGNSSNGCGGGFSAWTLAGDVEDCTFVRNSAYYGSALLVEDAPNTMVRCCEFVENTDNRQGALALRRFPGGLIENCRFVGNGCGSIWLDSGAFGVEAAVIRNCLFVAPDSLGNVDGWAIQTGHNTLIANNTMVGRGLTTQAWDTTISLQIGSLAWQGVLESRVCNNVIAQTQEGIRVPEGTDVPISYNLFYNVEQIISQGEIYLGNDLWWIESKLSSFRNNVYCDPGFVLGDLTYHIGASSPCVDSGDPNYVPETDETDLDGKPRLAGYAVDKGAYELQSLPDIPPQLLKAVSRKMHGEIGVFDIELSLDPNEVGVEGRVGGPVMIVLTLSEPVYAADGSCDVGQEVLISDPDVAASATLNCVDNTIIIEMSDLPDGTCMSITLEGLIDADAEETEKDAEVFLLVLRGDVNGDGTVDTLDVNQVNNALFEPADVPDFQFDVNTDGEINELDTNVVKDSLGGTAVCP